MGKKVYIDAVTGELTIDTGNTIETVPAFCELKRVRYVEDGLMDIKTIHNLKQRESFIIEQLHFSDAQDEAGTPYVSLQAFYDALTSYFDATV